MPNLWGICFIALVIIIGVSVLIIEHKLTKSYGGK